MNISKLLNDIIPPNDHQHRNGFTNKHIIDALIPKDKVQIEAELISMLQKKTDMLIVETLSYMKSDKSLSLFYELLENPGDEMARIIIAVSIFEINQDEKLFELAKSSFSGI